MLWTATLDPEAPRQAARSLVDAWSDDDNLVFVLRAGAHVADPLSLYDSLLGDLGTAIPFAEDGTTQDRSAQRTGELWMEVRYDSRYQHAFRHSSDAQPLHTDGSYIPDYPNATLMICVANDTVGGETTFVSGADVVAALAAEDPELLAELSAVLPHARSGDRRLEPVIDIRDDEPPLMNWNYYCVDRADAAESSELADRYFGFLASSPAIAARTVPVRLQPGDCVAWKDRLVLHGRGPFSPSGDSARFLWKCAIDIGRFS